MSVKRYLSKYYHARRINELNKIEAHIRSLMAIVSNYEHCVKIFNDSIEKSSFREILIRIKKWWFTEFSKHKLICESVEKNEKLLKKLNYHEKIKCNKLMSQYTDLKSVIEKIKISPLKKFVYYKGNFSDILIEKV